MKNQHRLKVVLTVLLIGIALSAVAVVSVSAAARQATTSELEEQMGSALSTVMRQPAAKDDYVLPTGDTLTVHTLNLGASNAYLLETDEGLVLVDAGAPFVGGVILDYMEQIGRDDLKLIYITHAHIDHYGSAAEVRRETGAPIAIHPDDAAHMADGKTKLGNVRGWNRLSNLALPWVEPLLTIEETEADILVVDGDRLDVYGLPATVAHVPGHTPGSTAVVVDGGVSFVGDLLSATGDPHVQSSYAYDWSQLPASLRHLAAFDPTLMYTGHGAEPIDVGALDLLITDFEAKLESRRQDKQQ